MVTLIRPTTWPAVEPVGRISVAPSATPLINTALPLLSLYWSSMQHEPVQPNVIRQAGVVQIIRLLSAIFVGPSKNFNTSAPCSGFFALCGTVINVAEVINTSSPFWLVRSCAKVLLQFAFLSPALEQLFRRLTVCRRRQKPRCRPVVLLM